MITQSFYTLEQITVLFFFCYISLEQPLKNTKSSITTSKKYVDHPAIIRI